jgi:hypothetical protein
MMLLSAGIISRVLFLLVGAIFNPNSNFSLGPVDDFFSISFQAEDWSPPESIMSTAGSVAEGQMALVADPAGQLHLFYASTPDPDASPAISYQRWSEGIGWSEPVEIIYYTMGSAMQPINAAITPDGFIHLIWNAGLDRIDYSKAHIDQAVNPREWSPPISLAEGRRGPDIVAGRDGSLYLAFAGISGSGGIYLLKSDDAISWSDPITISPPISPASWPSDLQLAIDDLDQIHVVWTEFQQPEGWPPTGAYYTRSIDGGNTWTDPLRVAGLSHGQIGVGTVGPDQVHLLWRSTVGGDGTFHQVSNDGGLTWTNPDRYDDGGGFSGLPSFAPDSHGNMHMAIGFGKYTMWDGQQLSPYIHVTNPLFGQAESGAERALLAITAGNQVHIVTALDYRSLWSFRMILPFPPVLSEIPPTEPTIVESTMITPEAVELVIADPTPIPNSLNLSSDLSTAPTRPASSLPLLLSSLMVGAVILLLIIIRSLKKR